MDQLAVELVIDDQKATVKLDNFGQKVKLLSDNINNVGGDKQFAGKVSTDLDALSRRADATYKSFREIANVRLDSGNVGILTREILTAQTRSRQLAGDIVNIRRELANPNRTSTIAFLTTELKGAEKELDSLSRKLKTVSASAPPTPGQSNGFGASFQNKILGSDFGSAAFVGGLAGGAVVAGVGLVKDAVSSLLGEVKDLSIESVKLAANFEETTNSIAVFAGSTNAAKAELFSLDNIALKTNGLRLESAEEGYRRLRALGFEAKTATDLVVGLGKQRLIAGASEQNIQRVITHFEQISANPELASRDFKFAVRDLPTLRGSFKTAFGTSDYKELQTLVQADPTKFFDKLAVSMANTQQAQAGLNIAVEKGSDALIQAGRIFGEPFLKPLTRDVQDLTKYLRENENSIKSLGQEVADFYNGLSTGAKSDAGQKFLSASLSVLRSDANVLTGGTSEILYTGAAITANSGKKERLKTEAADQAKIFSDVFDKGVTADGTTVVFDQLTNTFKNLPSLAGKLETEKAVAQAKELKDNIEKIRKELSEFTFKVEGSDISQNLELNKAVAVRDAKGDSLKLARKTAALEIDALRQQISLSDRSTANKLQNLSPEDRASGKNLVIVQENAANIGKLNSQIQLTQINAQKQQQDEAKKLTTDFRNDLISLKSTDNPLVKQFSDFETATDRARLKFGAFGDEVVNKIATIERANLSKAIGVQQFENNLSALRFDQDARKLAATPERQFADFQRSLERVNQTADFTKTVNGLNRQIAESDYYAGKYNPNNPKSFAEYNRRGPNDDVSSVGLDIRNAVSDIRDLKAVSLDGTGALGRGAIADKILSSIPSRDELLKRLNSPFADVRGNADFLLQAQSGALIDKREFEKQKFNNFLEDQKTAEFGKVFAREQIGLINGSNLSDVEKAKRRLAVADSLGNDLDAGLKRQKIQDSIAARNDQLDKNAEALKATTDIRDALNSLVKQLAEKGIKLDGATLPPAVVNFKAEFGDNGSNAPTAELQKSATQSDTAAAYPGLSFFEENEARQILRGER